MFPSTVIQLLKLFGFYFNLSLGFTHSGCADVLFFQVGRGLDCIKRESSPLPCSSPVSLHKVTQTQQHPSPPPHQQQHTTSPSSQRTSPQSQARKLCSPDTSTPRHPELELSTTDSDTDSVNSLGNHSECWGIYISLFLKPLCILII